MNSKINEQQARQFQQEQDEIDQKTGNTQGLVAIIVGKAAMPTTVLLVLITCVSGHFLDEAKFTPVVGMIAPVVMALIMVIKEASVGKDDDTTLLNSESERKERLQQASHNKEIKLAKMETEERIKSQELKEQARQFDLFHSSTGEFLELIKETNEKLVRQIEKPSLTELAIGDTKVKITGNGTQIES